MAARAEAKAKILGTKMVSDGKTAKQIFDEVMADADRPRFGFGRHLAIVNIDFQNSFTRIDDYKTAFETDPHQIDYVNQISQLARSRGMPVFWTQVAYMGKVADAGLWRNRTVTREVEETTRHGA
ncbi:MAG: N-carbamoylsarcosine amidohydrolase, partial [Sphingobium sp.]